MVDENVFFREVTLRLCGTLELEQIDGRVHGEGGAADVLGLNPSTLRARMKKLGIPFGRSRSR